MAFETPSAFQGDCAPIAFFAFRRPKHTFDALSALSENALAERSTLFIYCDGSSRPADCSAVAEVRKVVRQHQWCRTVHIVERETNWGLANSVIAGVTELTDHYGAVIVLEDDLIVAPGFLRYMNTALQRYGSCDEVVQIAGYMLPIQVPTELDMCFLPFTTSWGWATWNRAWRHFDPAMKAFAEVIECSVVRRRFDLGDTYPFSHVARLQKYGKIDSWAIRWYLSTFARGGLTLYPARSLVSNTGFDGSGTHCDTTAAFKVDLTASPLGRWPDSVRSSEHVLALVSDYYRRHSFTRGARIRRWAARFEVLKNKLRNWGRHILGAVRPLGRS